MRLAKLSALLKPAGVPVGSAIVAKLREIFGDDLDAVDIPTDIILLLVLVELVNIRVTLESTP